jgi:hypothetical protein
MTRGWCFGGLVGDRQQRDTRRRRLQSMRVLSRGRNVDPGVGTLFTVLMHGEVERGTGSKTVGEKSREHQLIVVGIGQLAGPDDLLDALLHDRAVVEVIRFGVGPVLECDGPAGPRHGLHADHAFWDLDAHTGGRRAVAAVYDLDDGLVGCANLGLPGFEGGMSDRGGMRHHKRRNAGKGDLRQECSHCTHLSL